MGLESATFISELNENWPLSTDYVREGDNHLRLLKLALKNTFPNMNGQTTVKVSELNALTNLIGPIDQIITELLLHIEKPGTIKMWDIANKPSLPTGWYLCNGQTVTDYGTVPDMRDRFIIGGGNTYTNQSTGGSLTTSSDGGHTPSINGHALTVPEIPTHTHGLRTRFEGTDGTPNGYVLDASGGVTHSTESAGSGQEHSHTADAVADHDHTFLPPYYAAVFIIKCTDYVAPAEPT